MSQTTNNSGLVHKKDLERILSLKPRELKRFIDSGVIVPVYSYSRKTQYFDLKACLKAFRLDSLS